MGRAKLRLTVRDAAGKPVTGAHVTALAQMPGMPMGEREEEATPEPGQPGTYVAPAVYGMEGKYQITVKVTAAQGSGTGKVMVSTGQDTSGGEGGSPVLRWLVVLAALAGV